MKTYLLTAVGVILFSVLVSFIIPDGKLNQACKFVLRMICIVVLIQPITGLFNFSKSEQVANYNYEYICEVYSQTQSKALTQKISADLNLDCICQVEIVYDGEKIAEKGVIVSGSFENYEIIDNLTEYLKGLGYINISVNETGD